VRQSTSYLRTDLTDFSYELQVNPTFRGVGIGRTLMNMITDIGTAYEMERIMLTVLKGAAFLGGGKGILYTLTQSCCVCSE